MLAASHDHGQRLEKLLATLGPKTRGHNRNVLEADSVESLLNGALHIRQRVELVLLATEVVGIGVHAMQRRDERVHAARVPGKLRQVLDRVHHPATGIGQGQHEPLVSDKLPHASTLTAALDICSGHLELSAHSAPGRQEDG